MNDLRNKHLVVLTGAGISAESGIKTFRDSDGLWMGHDIYEVASPRGWKKNPELVLDFYNARRRDIAAAKPNIAHQELAALEEHFDVTIITQNIDDLHERAGSSRVIHLHGEIFRKKSSLDGSITEEVRKDMNLKELAPDGLPWRPDIVWFEEPVPLITSAAKITATADFFVIIGTSLQVYPAAGLIDSCPSETPVYVIDKRIPLLQGIGNFHPIEMNASEGISILKTMLMSEFL